MIDINVQFYSNLKFRLLYSIFCISPPESHLNICYFLQELHISEGVIRKKVKNLMNVGSNSLPEGRKRSLPKESEDELALCLQAKARLGLGYTRVEVQDIVKDYISTNKGMDTELGRYLDIHCQFKDNKPGKDWLISFMRRYNFSTKKPSALENTCKIEASNPEIDDEVIVLNVEGGKIIRKTAKVSSFRYKQNRYLYRIKTKIQNRNIQIDTK